MNHYLDHYCERLAPGLWGEPLNLLSNIAFILAGLLIWRALVTSRPQWNRVPLDIVILVALMFAIGIGSALWHLTAHYWALWGDRIPILLFMNLYLLSCLFRIVGMSLIKGIAVFIVYHIVNTGLLLALPTGFLNGSIFYLPTWLFLAGLTIMIWRQQSSIRRYYVWALITFTIALAFRTVDNVICAMVTTGTHFIWHLLVAITLYCLMQGLIGKYRISDRS